MGINVSHSQNKLSMCAVNVSRVSALVIRGDMAWQRCVNCVCVAYLGEFSSKKIWFDYISPASSVTLPRFWSRSRYFSTSGCSNEKNVNGPKMEKHLPVPLALISTKRLQIFVQFICVDIVTHCDDETQRLYCWTWCKMFHFYVWHLQAMRQLSAATLFIAAASLLVSMDSRARFAFRQQ